MVVGPKALPFIMQSQPCAREIGTSAHLKVFLRDIECGDARLLSTWGFDTVWVLKGHILHSDSAGGAADPQLGNMSAIDCLDIWHTTLENYDVAFVQLHDWAELAGRSGAC